MFTTLTLIYNPLFIFLTVYLRPRFTQPTDSAARRLIAFGWGLELIFKVESAKKTDWTWIQSLMVGNYDNMK